MLLVYYGFFFLHMSVYSNLDFCGFNTEAHLTLTAGSIPVVSEIALIKAALDARFLPHAADLRHAELWVGSKKQLPCFDGQIVLLPVPQILELLVVKC